MTGQVAVLLGAFLAAAALAVPSWQEETALRDSLSRVHPRMRVRWLAEHGIVLPGYFEPRAPESSGLRMVAKWGRGPSVEVTGRDSLVFLSLGSEVAIINFANPDSPRVLAEVQSMGLVCQAAVRDSFLYVGNYTGAAGIEIWNIENLAQPVYRNRVLTRLQDFCLKDSLALVTQRMDSPSRDTFKVYNLADPDNPQLLGFCPDSGDVVTVSGNTVIQGDWNDIHAIDITDPTHPRRVGSYPGGPLGLAARGTICCAAIYWTTDEDHFRFEILDISTPSSIRRVGYLDNEGGYDICLAESLAFMSGFQSSGFEFAVISIADSASPVVVGAFATRGNNNGVWANLAAGRAYVADRFEGLAELDITDPRSPGLVRSILVADVAQDITLVGSYAFVADNGAGLQILDVADPSLPTTIGIYDTLGFRPMYHTVAARDSFAFVDSRSGGNRFFRSVDVTNPADPRFAGDCELFNPPEDMACRDSFVYVAEGYRFQIVNVARPREPVLVGSCVLSGNVWDLDLEGNTAGIARILSLDLADVSRPDSPRVVGTWSGDVSGVDIVDTIAYVVAPYTGCVSLSIANASAPYVLDSLYLEQWWNDVAVAGGIGFVGGTRIHTLDMSDPCNLRVIGTWTPPYLVRRLVYSAPYLYAACYDAGVCILETVPTGIGEGTRVEARQPLATVSPSVTTDIARVRVNGPHGQRLAVSLYDVAGNVLLDRCSRQRASNGQTIELRLGELPPGVYVVRVDAGGTFYSAKVVKTNRR